VALAYLFNEGSKVLSGFTYACLFHKRIVLHVAQACKPTLLASGVSDGHFRTTT
jgi:hypothetical protein